MHKTILLLIGVAVLIAMLALTWVAQVKARPVKMSLSIHFLGYTNAPTGERTALFEISNASPFRVLRVSSAIHCQSSTLVPEPLSTPLDIYRPGEVQRTVLGAPTNEVPWKYEATFEESENGLNCAVRGLLYRCFPTHIGARPPSRRFSSDWVSP